MKKFSILLMLVATLLMSCGKNKETGDDDKKGGGKDSLVPTVSTLPVSDITSTSAVCWGEVESDGGAEVSARGIEYACASFSEPDHDCYMGIIYAGSGLGEFQCEITDLGIGCTYYVRAFATNKNGTSYGEEMTFTTPDPYNGYEYVDLGLPSGTKWATHNVGAANPYEAGNYYAWGDPKLKIQFAAENCPTYGQSMGDISGDTIYDIATALWGGAWRMPTEAEARELKDNCTWEWNIDGPVQGAIVTGPNGNSIFLPGAGFSVDSSVDFYESQGAYWISTPDPSDPLYFSYYLYFYTTNYCNLGWFSRYVGLSVRPVAD